MLLSTISVLESPDDQEFIKNLYNDYHRLMYSVAQKYFSTMEDRQDLVQSCLVRLIDHVDTIRSLDQRALVSYIVTTINNAAYTYYRKNCTINVTSFETLPETDDICTEDFVLDLVPMIDQNIQLSELWANISEEDKILLEGKYILGYTNVELAKYFKCKPDSIRMKLFRARRNALKILKENVEDSLK